VVRSYAKAYGDLVETAVGSGSRSMVTLVLKSQCRTDTILSKRFIQLNRSASSQEKGSRDGDVPGGVTHESPASQPRAPALSLRNAAPFVPAHDFARGAMMIFQTAINYTLMLVVMYALILPSLPPTDNVPVGRSMPGSSFPFSSD